MRCSGTFKALYTGAADMCHGRAKEELQTGAGRAAHAVPQPHEQPPLETKPLRPATIPGTTPPMISELKRAAASLDYDELHIGADVPRACPHELPRLSLKCVTV